MGTITEHLQNKNMCLTFTVIVIKSFSLKVLAHIIQLLTNEALDMM